MSVAAEEIDCAKVRSRTQLVNAWCRAAAAAGQECSQGKVALRHLVDVIRARLVDAHVPDVADLQRSIPRKLLLDGNVPLPRIGRDAARRSAAAGRCRCIRKRNRNVQRTSDGGADRERSRVGKADLRADAFALEELT